MFVVDDLNADTKKIKLIHRHARKDPEYIRNIDKFTVIINSNKQQQNILAENFLQAVPGASRVNREFVNQSIFLDLNSRILKTLDNLDFNVHMYSKGIFNYSDLYPNHFYKVELDRGHLQAVNAEYQLTTDKNGKRIVKVKGTDVVIHDFLTGKDVQRLSIIDLSLPVGTDGMVRHEYCSFRIQQNEIALTETAKQEDVFFTVLNNERLVSEYKDMDIVEAAKNATVINITLRAKSYAKAQAFLNKHMEMWLRDDLEKKNLTAVNTISFIDGQLNMMRDTLERMSRRLERFRVNNDVVMPELQLTGTYTQLQEIENKLLQLQLQKDYVRKLKTHLENRADYTKLISPEAAGINSPVLSTMVAELARIRGELYSSKDKDPANNPYLTELIQMERTTLATVKENLTSLDQFISSNVVALEKQRSLLRGSQNSMPAKEQELFDLKRAFDLTSEVNALLMSRRVETEVLKASSQSDNEILEFASEGKQVAPTLMIFAIGLFIGLGLPLLVIIVVQLFNNKIESEEDITALTHLPVIGHII